MVNFRTYRLRFTSSFSTAEYASIVTFFSSLIFDFSGKSFLSTVIACRPNFWLYNLCNSSCFSLRTFITRYMRTIFISLRLRAGLRSLPTPVPRVQAAIATVLPWLEQPSPRTQTPARSPPSCTSTLLPIEASVADATRH